MRDEIVSSLRLVYPVSADMLSMVCDHVKVSCDRPSCSFTDVPLNFVYGTMDSLQLFEKVFEYIRMLLSQLHVEIFTLLCIHCSISGIA